MYAYGEPEVLDGVNRLRELGMVRAVRSPGGRAAKYKHALDDVLEIDGEQSAVLAVLMLRGEQTPGELRLRTERYHDFASVAEMEEVLGDLEHRDTPLARRLERRPGEKEARYRHLMGSHSDAVPESPAASSPGETDELEALRLKVEDLEARVSRLEEIS
ncbi:MAG: DUF480 domain-containing protein [Acidimicrobiia bacterium]